MPPLMKRQMTRLALGAKCGRTKPSGGADAAAPLPSKDASAAAPVPKPMRPIHSRRVMPRGSANLWQGNKDCVRGDMAELQQGG